MQQISHGQQHKLLLNSTCFPRSSLKNRSVGYRSPQAPQPPKAASTEQVDNVNSNGASANATNPLDFDELTDIIRMVHDTDIVELELKSKRFSLAVRKKEAIEKPEPVYQAGKGLVKTLPRPLPVDSSFDETILNLLLQIPAAAPAASPALAPAPSAPSPPSQASAAPAPSSPAPSASASSGASAGGHEVTSPMSGTFYHSPAPGEPPFVKVGDKVTKGQTIGIIEAMKLMNEIEADESGTVVEFIADNRQSVAPGQGLVRIQP